MKYLNPNVRWTLVLLTVLSPIAVSLMLAGPFTGKGTQPESMTNPLIPPGNCQTCHGNFNGSANIEPHPTWSGSMMAQAGRDPIFWAALDVANNDVPGIGDYCLRCHSPTGWLAGRSEEPGGSPDGCGLQGQIDSFGQDFDGITCHLCHRMYENPFPPVGEDPVYFENGQYWVDDAPCPNGTGTGPCRRGPYTYPEPGFSNEPRHEWAQSDYHVNGDLCGNCHNVTNPLLNLIDGGVDTGVGFPIERTFMEWQQSDYSDDSDPAYQTCQNCHMRDATKANARVCILGGFPSRQDNMPVHEFAGGNAWVPDVIRQEYPDLFIADELTATRNWALDMLQNHSADVEITVPADVDGGSNLNVDVKVTNLTGHKLPTGYAEGRRMWLNLRVLDGDSNLIWESGAYDSLTGVLTHDAQAKIYHAEQGIWNNDTAACEIEDETGTPMFHFASNNCVAIDNRIPPLGFTGGSHIESQPKNYFYPETSPGSGVLVNYDTTSYTIPIPEGTPSPLTLASTLRYQTTSKEYVEFLLAEANENDFPDDCIERLSGFPTESRGQLLMDMWDTYDKAPPVDMDGDTGVVAVNVVLGSAGDVIATYTAATAATDHSIYIGDLVDVATLTLKDQDCGVGTDGTATFVAGTGSKFFLVVGNDGTSEGSYGKDGHGAERVVSRTQPPCVPQQ